MNTIRNGYATGGWRALVSESVIGTLFSRVPDDQPVRDPIADTSTDDAVLRLGRSSAVLRAIVKPAGVIADAWPHSLAAAGLFRWLTIPLDVRVRVVAVMVSVAALTHIAVTRFRAPQPTTTARAIWVVVLMLLATTAVASRPIAAAWTDWRERGTKTREGDTA